MCSQERNQISICVLKSKLEEIESGLIEQHSAWPEVNAEIESKRRETMNVLQNVRSLCEVSEQLHHENLFLAAKRMQLKQQSDEIQSALEMAQETRLKMEEALKLEELEIEKQTQTYEDSLHEITDRFRKTQGYYNEEEIKREIAKVEDVVSSLEDDVSQRQAAANGLRCALAGLKADVHEDLLDILGKKELEAYATTITPKYEALLLKRNELLKPRNTTPPPFVMKK